MTQSPPVREVRPPIQRTAARADLIAAGAAGGLVVAAWAVGSWLTAHGADVYAPTPPLYAGYAPHVGPGSLPALVLAVLVALRGPELAARLAWRPLLAVGYLASVAWTTFLALVDGWRTGIAGRLTVPTEYLHEVPGVTDIGVLLRTFTTRILAFGPHSFTTHVAAHPPGALLVFVGLDRIGLGGGGPAGVLCILVGASTPVAVALTLRALGGAPLARAGLPFLVLAPAAVWVGVSADGLFAGVLAWGVALLALGAAGRRDGARWVGWSLAGGLLLGGCLYLSYGLVLGGLFPLVVLALTRRIAPIAVATGAAGAVAGAFTAAGFWWPTGYQLTKILYGQPLQLGTERPYGYWVWAAPAALAIAVGPATVAGLRRLVASVPIASGPTALGAAASASAASGPTVSEPGPTAPAATRDRGLVALVLLGAAALTAVLLADVSGLSRGEVERIWLPWAFWLVAATALLPGRHASRWLLAQAVVALAVNHLLVPPW
ncbi:MAG TPA: hypothetical protein VGD73_27955 [Pseudonocardia sp.]|uniref:hypothetical protein n=1 Tax=Pseudonocardia sp. TaxID=60912 RepID=UPI002EDAA2D1